MRKPKILFAEDEDYIFNLIDRANKNVYNDLYDFKHAHDTKSALSMLEDHFDAYIIDGLNGGWKIIYESVRKKSRDCPFILYSSNQEAMDKTRILMNSDKKLGMIEKPAEFEYFFDYLGQFLRKS